MKFGYGAESHRRSARLLMRRRELIGSPPCCKPVPGIRPAKGDSSQEPDNTDPDDQLQESESRLLHALLRFLFHLRPTFFGPIGCRVELLTEIDTHIRSIHKADGGLGGLFARSVPCGKLDPYGLLLWNRPILKQTFPRHREKYPVKRDHLRPPNLAELSPERRTYLYIVNIRTRVSASMMPYPSRGVD